MAFIHSNYAYNPSRFSCNICAGFPQQISVPVDESKLREIENKIKELNLKEPDLTIKQEFSTRVVNINWSSLGPGWV